eukprot:scaffold8023_cov103-Isochrysis_galbana.AAC.14
MKAVGASCTDVAMRTRLSTSTARLASSSLITAPRSAESRAAISASSGVCRWAASARAAASDARDVSGCTSNSTRGWAASTAATASSSRALAVRRNASGWSAVHESTAPPRTCTAPAGSGPPRAPPAAGTRTRAKIPKMRRTCCSSGGGGGGCLSAAAAASRKEATSLTSLPNSAKSRQPDWSASYRASTAAVCVGVAGNPSCSSADRSSAESMTAPPSGASNPANSRISAQNSCSVSRTRSYAS